MQPQFPQGQPSDQPGQPGYPQGQPGYPQQGQPGYQQQSQPGYPQQSQPGYPQQSQPGYPQQGQPGYSQQGQAGYPQSPGQPGPGQFGYPPQGQGGYSPQQPGYPQGPQGNPSMPQNSWASGPVGGQMVGGTGPGPGIGSLGGRVARRAGFGVMRLVISLIVLVVLAVGGWGFHQLTKSDAEKVQVGQCVKLSGTSHDPKFNITSCDSMDANYKVVDNKDGSTCPDDADASAWQTGKYSYHLCLQMNVKQGDCLHDGLNYHTKVGCGSSDADYKVTGVLTGATDDTGCSDDTKKFAKYTKPEAMVVCLGPAR